MADNLSELLKNLTSGMDKNSLMKSASEFKKIIATPEGKKLISAIKASDKESLSKLLREIKQSGSPTDALKQMSEKPEILKDLAKMLGKEDLN